MSYGRHVWSHRFLCWGLGIVFLWIGLDILKHPDMWIGYVPTQLPFGFDRSLALKMNGVFDAAIGSLLMLGWWPKIIAALAAFHLIGILVDQGIDQVIIRDVGLFGASLALLFWPKRRYDQH